MDKDFKQMYSNMIFKNKKIIREVMQLIIAIHIVSCTSHEQKNDAAFDRVKEKKQITNDSTIVNNAMTKQIVKTKSIAVSVKSDDRTDFKNETSKLILNNEEKIKEIRTIPDPSGAMYRKVSGLEKENDNLSILLDQYNKEEELKWVIFKTSMYQQVNDIKVELKTIKIKNSK